MIDRRKFLERSVLSTGSVIFSSALLQSCTKYGIPFPGGNPNPSGPNPVPPIIPSLGAINWNDSAKTVVIAGLELVPEAGEILGPLAEIFWPSSQEDVWGEVKEEVEALVNQKIDDLVYQLVKEDLQGLNGAITLYVKEVNNGTPSEKLTQWQVTNTLFVEALPHFKSAGNELPLLPLFAQFANMYLAILRDVVISGKDWGRSDADHQQDIKDLTNTINDFVSYTTNTYYAGRTNLQQNAPSDRVHFLEPFRTLNAYDRQMTLAVFDFMDTWPYYDVTVYPTKTTVVLTREIYSDPMGTCDDSGDIKLTLPPPTQGPITIDAWGGDWFNSIQLTYPQGSGPGGVTQTPRMGDVGSVNRVNESLSIPVNDPIMWAQATYGSVVNTIQFVYYDGRATAVFGNTKGSNLGTWGFDSRRLSRVHINGVSKYYNSADCVVFGFQHWQAPSATLRAIRALYVQSPKERSAADFVQAFPNLAIPANFITPELKATRQAHWAYIEARALALK